MSVNPVPEGYRTITPHLTLEGASKAIEFYKKAFGAEEVDRAPDPSGQKIWHASLRIGDSMIFVNDVFAEMGGTQSQSSMWLYVPDTDAAFKRAVEAGATGTVPPSDMFWGDRMAIVGDPFGQRWTIATRIKNMTPGEIKEAEEAFAKQMKAGKP
jgi:PhnB protein